MSRDATGRTIDRVGLAITIVVVLAWALALPFSFTVPVGILTATGLLAALAGLFRPWLGLLGVSLLCVMDSISRIFLLSGGLLRWNTFNYLLLLVALLNLPKLAAFRDVHSRLLLVFALLLLAELVITPNFEFGSQHVINLLGVFGLLVYCSTGGTKPETWVWLGIIGGAAGAMGGLLYYLRPPLLEEVNANAWGLFPVAALTTACLGYQFARGRPIVSLALGALGAVNLTWIFLSGSRGNLVVGAICGAFLIISTPGVGRRTMVLATLAAVALVVSAQFTSLQEVALHRITRLIDPTIPLASRTSGRSDLILGGWYIFMAHPFGVGTGGFAWAWATLPPHPELSGFQAGREFQAHSGWIKILAENGLPGVLILGAFAASFAVVAVKRKDRRLRLLGYLTSAVLISAWVVTEFQSKGLWFMAAATATLLRGEPRSRNAPSTVPRTDPRRVRAHAQPG